MKNVFGTNISVTLFGESHGEEIGAAIDGLAPGIKVDMDYIAHRLSLRRPMGKISTSRKESDNFRIVSGVFEGYTTGTPLCILIPNQDTDSSKYEYLSQTPRPGHGDYTGFCKYGGFADHRGGGHFSGRITAPLVAAGAIILKALEQKGIVIATHIKSIGEVTDAPLQLSQLKSLAARLNSTYFATIDEKNSDLMQKEIEKAASEGDSIGGVLETFVDGLPAGLGEPWFDSVESLLAHGLFSVPAVKGVEFGAGFGITKMRGSQANDGLRYKDGTVVTETNNNGGINGGITNGMPVVFSVAVKPTPSVFVPQNTVNLKTGENAVLNLKGRHDPCIVHRARAVVDSITAFVVADLLATRFGTNYLGEK